MSIIHGTMMPGQQQSILSLGQVRSRLSRNIFGVGTDVFFTSKFMLPNHGLNKWENSHLPAISLRQCRDLVVPPIDVSQDMSQKENVPPVYPLVGLQEVLNHVWIRFASTYGHGPEVSCSLVRKKLRLKRDLLSVVQFALPFPIEVQ